MIVELKLWTIHVKAELKYVLVASWMWLREQVLSSRYYYIRVVLETGDAVSYKPGTDRKVLMVQLIWHLSCGLPVRHLLVVVTLRPWAAGACACITIELHVSVRRLN